VTQPQPAARIIVGLDRNGSHNDTVLAAALGQARLTKAAVPAAVTALAVAALPAVPAGAARRNARRQHPITRSPGTSPLTPAPTSTTVPTASWPRIRPGCTAGTSPPRMCRSVPQMVSASTR
jgi:hypothetical protein